LHPVEQFSYRPGAPPPRADDALADLICGYLRKCQADLAPMLRLQRQPWLKASFDVSNCHLVQVAFIGPV
jgi:hypothetical protein